MTSPRRWIRVSECAEICSLSVKGCYELISRGVIPAVHIGRTVRVDRVGLERDLEAQAQGQQVGARGKA